MPAFEEVSDALEVRRTYLVAAGYGPEFERQVLGRPDPQIPGLAAVDVRLAEIPDDPRRLLAVVIYQPNG